jgi:hypothetical protein
MQARVRSDTDAFAGKWHDESTTVDVHVGDGRLTATWTVREKKFRATGSVHGESAKLDYEEMEYITITSGPSELGYRKRAIDRWRLAPDCSVIEIMRIQDGDTEMRQLRRNPE